MDASHSDASASKAKGLDHDDGVNGFRPQPQLAVVPPRKEDLQRSYAAIVANDANPQGWYGSMSMSSLFPRLL